MSAPNQVADAGADRLEAGPPDFRERSASSDAACHHHQQKTVMKNKNAVNGQVTGLQNITRLGALVMTLSLAATSAHAVSASRSVSVGNSTIGATAVVSFNDFVSGDMYRATVAGRADGKVLSVNLPLASGTSSLEIRRPYNCHAYGSIKAGGVTLTSWDTSFSGSRVFSTPRLSRTLIGGSTRVWVGPLPISLRIGVNASIYARGTVTVSLSPNGTPIVRGVAGPVLDAAATGSAGVDVLFAGVDVTGSLSLIGVGMTGDITYSTPGLTYSPIVAYRATADIYSLDGSIRLCAWVDPPFISRSEWCKTLYSFHGGHSSYLIASGSRRLIPLPFVTRINDNVIAVRQ
jgi:hypothetical protein